ncbi:MAG: PQQ-binding-like beta-propeller repeat protein, partial [Candidatus Andersenbacteria bacterium]
MKVLQMAGIILGIIVLASASYFGAIAYKNSTLSKEKNVVTKFLELPLSKDVKKILTPQAQAIPQDPNAGKDFKTAWFADYSGNRIVGVDRASGTIIWNQAFSFPSVEESGQASNAEFMTVAPNSDIMMSNSNGMLIQELDRTSHEVVWQYGVLNQQYCNKCLHQPKKAYLISNGTEVLVTDANNRRVIIIDKATKQVVWEYGHKAEM